MLGEGVAEKNELRTGGVLAAYPGMPKFFTLENLMQGLSGLWRNLGIPSLSIAVFLLLWAQLSSAIVTSLGELPGPVQVYEETHGL